MLENSPPTGTADNVSNVLHFLPRARSRTDRQPVERGRRGRDAEFPPRRLKGRPVVVRTLEPSTRRTNRAAASNIVVGRKTALRRRLSTWNPVVQLGFHLYDGVDVRRS